MPATVQLSGGVSNVWVGKSKSGNDYGRLTVCDDSYALYDFMAFGNELPLLENLRVGERYDFLFELVPNRSNGYRLALVSVG